MRYSWTLTQYFMKRFFVWLVGTIFTLSALLFLVDYMSILRRASHLPDVRTTLMVKMTLLRVPYLLEQVTPIVFVIATMLCLWSLGRRNEVIAVKAVGGSFRQVVLPFILVSACAALVDIGILNPLSRFMLKRFEILETRYLKQNDQQFMVSENGIWTRLVEGKSSRIYRISQINRTTRVLNDISVMFFDKDGYLLTKRIDAQYAYLDGVGRLILRHGWEILPDKEPVKFATRQISSQLRHEDLEERYLNPRLISFWQIPNVIRLLEASGLNASTYVLYWHMTFARLFLLMGMVLLGAMAMMEHARASGIIARSALSLGGGFFVFAFREILFAMGVSGSLPILMSAWFPAILSWAIPLAVLVHREDVS